MLRALGATAVAFGLLTGGAEQPGDDWIALSQAMKAMSGEGNTPENFKRLYEALNAKYPERASHFATLYFWHIDKNDPLWAQVFSSSGAKQMGVASSGREIGRAHV